MAIEKLGIVEEGVRRRLHYCGAPVVVPRPVLKAKALFEKGRYVPRSLDNLITMVANHADTTEQAICGEGRRRKLVDARSCIANLAEEFAPSQSAAAVDSAMLRGSGMCIWYRDRHDERTALYPEYGALYERVRGYLVK